MAMSEAEYQAAGLAKLADELECARVADNGAWMNEILRRAYTFGLSDGYDKGWNRAMDFVTG